MYRPAILGRLTRLVAGGRRGPTGRAAPVAAAATLVGGVLIAGLAGGLGSDDRRGRTLGAGTPSAITVAGSDVAAAVAPSTAAAATTTTTTVVDRRTTLAEPLRLGSTGAAVERLQERLAELRFEPGPIDGSYGELTRQAVWAFQKLVLNVARDDVTDVVTDELWQRIQDPLDIQPYRSYAAGQTTIDHTEVYLPQQVVVFFENDEPVLIAHISSGSGETWRQVVTIDPGEPRNRDGTEPIEVGLIGDSITPGGVYTYERFIQGRRQSALGGMYNPAYFNYGIAIHGAENVPNYPASHGCIRLNKYIGERFQQFVAKGDQVWVWDGVTEPEMLGQVVPPFDRVDPEWAATTTTTTEPPPTTTTTTHAPTTSPTVTHAPATQPPSAPASTTPPTVPPTAPAPTTAPPTSITD